MMRSLYSGIAGLKNHQIRLDVIGNNIANVNTIGFKGSRVVFQDIYSQTVKPGSAGSQDGLGGTNAMQIGLGVRIASIDIIHTNAATQGTDNAFDLAIDGDGFFVARDYTLDPAGTDLYTRVGNFRIDDQGYLVTSEGYYVVGANTLDMTTDPITYPTAADLPIDWNAIVLDPDETGYDPVKAGKIYVGDNVGFGVSQDGVVTITKDDVNIPIARLAVALFTNPTGLEKAGNSLYRETVASGGAQMKYPTNDGAGVVNGGGLEMSNVDLSAEFTDMIITQRGYQANSRIISVSDTMIEELVNLKR